MAAARPLKTMTDKLDIDYAVKARESYRVVHIAPAHPDYTADGLMDIVVDTEPIYVNDMPRPEHERVYPRWKQNTQESIEKWAKIIGNITDVEQERQ